jgi:hypothetical protein
MRSAAQRLASVISSAAQPIQRHTAGQAASPPACSISGTATPLSIRPMPPPAK